MDKDSKQSADPSGEDIEALAKQIRRGEAGATARTAAAWIFGILLLAGVIMVVLHIGDMTALVATFRRAEPAWLLGAAGLQILTYICAAMVWWRVLARLQTRLPFKSLLGLAVVQLYANQAVPTGGVSGTVIVFRGLGRRGVAAPTAVTTLFVGGFAFYVAYLLVGLAAFVLFWHLGDLDRLWETILIAFIVVLAGLAALLVAGLMFGARLIPPRLRRLKWAMSLTNVLKQIPSDTLADIGMIAETVAWQSAVFVLDAATLYCSGRAIGEDLITGGYFVAFILASVVATLSPVPLGLGTFEATSTGILHLFGAPVEAGLAATLVLRGFTLWFPMIPGLLLSRREMRAGREGR